MKLFKQLNQAAQYGENVVYSPISTYILLSLLANGAVDKTQDELLSCLSPNNAALDHLNSLINTLLDKLNTINCITIATMFATNDQPYDLFKEICDKYSVEISKLTDAQSINTWASIQTKGMITKVIESIEKMSFVLINAVYFKGTWAYIFPKSNTYLATFNSSKGKVKCSMMTQFNIVSAIFGNKDYEAIQLLYSESDDIRAAYIKPISENIDDFIKGMTSKKLTLILRDLQTVSYRMRISIPKMNIEGNNKLIPVLESMRLNNVFGNKGDIPKIIDNFNGIDDITQKCIIKVNEEGTEAAAVSTITGKHGRPKEVIFGSSFIFVIFHKEFPDNFLFIAKVENPHN